MPHKTSKWIRLLKQAAAEGRLAWPRRSRRGGNCRRSRPRMPRLRHFGLGSSMDAAERVQKIGKIPETWSWKKNRIHPMLTIISRYPLANCTRSV